MRAYLDLLRRERDFRRVYAAELISLGGDWFAVIPLLTLLPQLTGTGLWGGLVLAVETLTVAVLSPYAGTVADRVDRRRLMVTADLASAGLVLLLLLVRSGDTVWIALVAIGGVAAAKAFFTPASSAALPNLVDPADLPTANVLIGAAWGTMLAVGAALGGLGAALVGPDACFVVDAVSFGLSALLVSRTRRPFQGALAVSGDRPRWGAQLREVAAYARSSRPVLALLTVKSAVGLGNGTLVLFPLLSTGVFGVGSLGTGLFFAARGLGAVLGPVALRRRAADPRSRWALLGGGMLLFGVGYGLFGVLAGRGTGLFVLALGLVVVAHVGGGANWVLSAYALQDTVPDRLRGRVFSVDFMLATLAISASQASAGALSGLVDPRVLAVGFGGVTFVYGLGWLAATRRVLRGTGGAAGVRAVEGVAVTAVPASLSAPPRAADVVTRESR